MEIQIREEKTKDVEQVREILCAAFPSDAESKLVDALRANHKAMISLVAVHAEQVLGHILLSPVSTIPPGEAKGIGLAPLAVHEKFRRLGIGSRLIREGLQRCRELGYDYCVVLGSPGYYQRFGFETASKHGVQNEYGVDEAFMLARLSEKEVVQGVVSYTPEFAMFAV